MVKARFFLIAVLLLGAALISGCNTLKDITTGIATGATEGITQDTSDFWHGMVKADDWMREHLW
jgi:predicted small secreted protein